MNRVDELVRAYAVDAADLDLRGKVLLLAEINKGVRKKWILQETGRAK